jgi:hypothetical protein
VTAALIVASPAHAVDDTVVDTVKAEVIRRIDSASPRYPVRGRNRRRRTPHRRHETTFAPSSPRIARASPT